MEINIEFKGIPLRVVGEYEAGEETVIYYSDMSSYPDSRGSYYPHTIYAEDSDIDLVELFSPADLEVLAEKILDKLED